MADHPPLTPDVRRERAAELRRGGLTVRQIAGQLGVSTTTVSRDLRAAKVPTVTGAPGLGERGAAFWGYVATTFDMDAGEREMLTQVCRLLDRANQLAAEVAAHGVIVTSARGEPRPHPAIAEERQVSLALGRLLSQLEIPDSDDDGGSPGLRSASSVRASRAARSRWDRAPLRGVPDDVA